MASRVRWRLNTIRVGVSRSFHSLLSLAAQRLSELSTCATFFATAVATCMFRPVDTSTWRDANANDKAKPSYHVERYKLTACGQRAFYGSRFRRCGSPSASQKDAIAGRFALSCPALRPPNDASSHCASTERFTLKRLDSLTCTLPSTVSHCTSFEERSCSQHESQRTLKFYTKGDVP